MPKCTTIRDAVIKRYKEVIVTLSIKCQVNSGIEICNAVTYTNGQLMQSTPGLMSFTFDIWSDGLRKSFLALTAHWVSLAEAALTLQSSLVAFRHISGPHTGEHIANVLFGLFEQLNITKKVHILVLEDG